MRYFAIAQYDGKLGKQKTPSIVINGNEKTACFLFKQAVIVRCNTKSFAKCAFVAKIQHFRLKFYAMRDFLVFFRFQVA